ncbi:unnamed protein product [Paramecium octaurelia]|uniref:Uncharacterized protein n=1 Tax=Paramecium octaurelia TaxID=43137 RepID=A0A8S1WD60_PAROT|nr:unnamed protein product [Paramecium octaurelia]
MRKNEYDLFVDDQISSKKYQVTLKCKYYTKVSQLKKYLHKFIKQNFDIIHNDITLVESMIVDQIFSLHCQNIITICRKIDPMIEILVNHKIYKLFRMNYYHRRSVLKQKICKVNQIHHQQLFQENAQHVRSKIK